MTDGTHIPQEDLALYALQALSASEAETVRRHVAECPACREEVAAISGDLALVAMSVDQKPLPEGARQRFVDRIHASVASEPSTNKAPAQTQAQVVSIDRPRKSRHYGAWMGWAAAAALLLISADLGVRVSQLSQQLEHATTAARNSEAENMKAREVLEVLTAPTAQRVVLTTGKTPPAPTARAVYLPSRGGLVLQASNMQALPEGKTYELWVIPSSGAPIPAGLFRPDTAGSASLVLPSIPQGVQAKAFGVTIENAGGSATPTAPIVLSGAAPASGE